MDALFYVNELKQRVGPVDMPAMKRLVKDGAIDGLTLVWSSNLDGWKPISDIPELRAMLAAEDDEDESSSVPPTDGAVAPTASTSTSSSAGADALYHYADSSGLQSGPVPAEAIGSLLEAGYLNGSTLVWVAGMASWLPVSQVPELSARFSAAMQRATAGPVAEPEAEAVPAMEKPESAAAEAGDADSDGNGTDDEAMEEFLAATGAAPSKKRKREEEGDEDDGRDDDDDLQRPDGADGDDGQGNTAGADANKQKKKKKKKKSKNGWKGAKENSWLYVSGLPPDVSSEELAEHFKKAGILRLDPLTNQPKIKIYTDEATGQPKGDASICYFNVASVELAVELLDGVGLRDMLWPLSVEPAKFEKKEGVQPNKPAAGAAGGGRGAPGAKRKLTADEQSARIKALEQKVKLSWAEDGADEGTGLHIVVLKGLFTAEEVKLALTSASGAGDIDSWMAELEGDVRPELEERCGEIEKFTIFPQHPGWCRGCVRC